MFSLDDLKKEIARFTTEDGIHATAIPGLSLIRFSKPSEPTHGLIEPVLCIVAQGRKRTITGDRALAFRIEPAYLGRPTGWLQGYQLYGFYDGGKVWYRDDPATGDRPGESLASAGFGTRALLGANVSATLEIAWPLTRPIASYGDDGDDPRILGSMVIRF